MKPYLLQVFELPPSSNDYSCQLRPIEPPQGYELAVLQTSQQYPSDGSREGVVVVLWKRDTWVEPARATETVHCNSSGVTEEVVRQGAADGSHEYLAPGASVGLRQGDRVVLPVARSDRVVYWRGSVTDLLTDLSSSLSVEQLQELAAEAALAWKRKRALGKEPVR